MFRFQPDIYERGSYTALERSTVTALAPAAA
jgi:hypothetical protein